MPPDFSEGIARAGFTCPLESDLLGRSVGFWRRIKWRIGGLCFLDRHGLKYDTLFGRRRNDFLDDRSNVHDHGLRCGFRHRLGDRVGLRRRGDFFFTDDQFAGLSFRLRDAERGTQDHLADTFAEIRVGRRGHFDRAKHGRLFPHNADSEVAGGGDDLNGVGIRDGPERRAIDTGRTTCSIVELSSQATGTARVEDSHGRLLPLVN
jgi:hypothetical protein